MTNSPKSGTFKASSKGMREAAQSPDGKAMPAFLATWFFEGDPLIATPRVQRGLRAWLVARAADYDGTGAYDQPAREASLLEAARIGDLMIMYAEAVGELARVAAYEALVRRTMLEELALAKQTSGVVA